MCKNEVKKRIIVLVAVVIMLFGMLPTTAFAYSSSCTVGPVAPRTTAPGHITLSSYVGLGKNLYAKVVSGSIGSGENIKILVTHNSRNLSIQLSQAYYSYTLPVSFALSGDWNITVQNNTSNNVKVYVAWQ